MDSKIKLSFGIQKGVILLLAFLALWVGALVYIHLRFSNPLFVRWIEAACLEKLFLFHRNIFVKLPPWLVFSLPSILWAFAYSIVITGIWWFSPSRVKNFWLASVFVLPVGWELLQLGRVVPGTFSAGDVFFGAMGAAAGMFFGTKIIKPKYYEKKSV